MFGIPPKLQCLFCLDEYTSGSTTSREMLRYLAPSCRTQSVSCLCSCWHILLQTAHCSTAALACSFLFRQEYFKQILCAAGEGWWVIFWYCLQLQYSSSENKCKSPKTNSLLFTASFITQERLWSQQWSQFPIPHSSGQLCPVSSLWRVWQLVLTAVDVITPHQMAHINWEWKWKLYLLTQCQW